MIRKVREVQIPQHTTRACLHRGRIINSLRTPSKAALEHLKKRIQLHAGETRTAKEELEKQKAENNELIDRLRTEILKKRLEILCPGANECLLRKALKDHHTGSSIFREKEPRDVSDQVDYELSDLKNKLNHLRNERRKKNALLAGMLTIFNDAVEDVVYLEIEGPMGDSRCLALENHIGDVRKGFLEAETLHHTYKHIRDQLELERVTNDSCIEFLNRLISRHDDEFSSCQKSSGDARRRKEDAITTALKTEVDTHAMRKARDRESSDLKRQEDEHRHELAQLRKNIQLFFASQDAVPLGRAISNPFPADDDAEVSAAEEQLKVLEAESALLQDVTGSRSIQEAAGRYETQETTFEHLQSLAKELEVRKSVMLRRLDTLEVDRNSSLYRDQPPEDALLKAATDERRRQASCSAAQKWSALAASSRVTQALARLRQLLEYLVQAMARAGVLEPPPRRLARLETDAYMATMMELAASGVRRLMQQLGADEPDETLRRAAAARFALTSSERRLTLTPQPAVAAGVAMQAALAAASTDGETTGDEVVVAARVTMKEQAQLIVQAKLKAGFGKKRLL